ncbi:hypothetical protein BD310DRAFT_942406 [Dichomitus squalens]|uniref:Uncharacterized protein n=1 Tax=Dichomitus squalens TaxID=114155 RepID=A0A4Q9PA30_9APHY|nr:hypothetical protein BD310DRAFT_942406 [Dichomitus squalens]
MGSLGGTPLQGGFCDPVRQHQYEDTDANNDTNFPSSSESSSDLSSIFCSHTGKCQKQRGESDMRAMLDEELGV